MAAQKPIAALIISENEAETTQRQLLAESKKSANLHFSHFRFEINKSPLSIFFTTRDNAELLSVEKIDSYLLPSTIHCRVRANIVSPTRTRIDDRKMIVHLGAVIRVKTDRAAAIDEWAEKLDLLNEEALESIRRDGITQECWFSFCYLSEQFLFGYMERYDPPPPPPPNGVSELEIDKIHRKFKENWDRNSRFECAHVLSG